MASPRLFYVLIESPVFFHLSYVLSAFPPSSVLFPAFNDRAYFATRDKNTRRKQAFRIEQYGRTLRILEQWQRMTRPGGRINVPLLR